MPIVKCQKCGKEFSIIPSRIKRGRGKFCSKACQYPPKPKIHCKQCGKAFYKNPSQILKTGNFCSRECRAKWMSINMRGKNSPSWKNPLPNVKCNVCGKKFYKKLFKVSKHNFCSRQCWYIWQTQYTIGKNSPYWNRIKRICKKCGRVFWVIPSRLKRKSGYYCSKKCALSCFPRSNTSLEKKMAYLLKENEILFEPQVFVEKIAHIDFLLPHKIAIQCDGAYWHRTIQQKA